MSEHLELNARRLLCPMPVIRTQDKIKQMTHGDTLTVICTDPGALNDIPTWCRINQHRVIRQETINDEYLITLEVGPSAPN
ncbi:MAG: sulfurtransferase TusA family protein [Pseudomonadales bacterium]|nr:sulfurtransferase TusA family protein [Pseudomonadales bacterium]